MSGIYERKDFHFSNWGAWPDEMFPRMPWPPPAHQSDIYSRGYGLYSLFPGDSGLYSPGGKLPPGFISSPKVTEPLFTFTGGGHGLPCSPHPALQQLEVLSKTFAPQRLLKTEEEETNGHCFPSSIRPSHELSPSGSPVAVIDLSKGSGKKMTVKQEHDFGKLGRMRCASAMKSELRVGVPNGCPKLSLPSPNRPVTLVPSPGSCSRTTPVSFRPPELAVKKEPLLSPAEASVFLSPPSDSEAHSNSFKFEAVLDKNSGVHLEMTRQRYPLVDAPPCLPTSLHHANNPSPLLGAVYTGGGVCDDRTPNQMPLWPAQPHNPTLWQYSAPMEQYPPVGFQLIRDPITGHLMLIPSASMEAVQRAILWPSYANNGGQMVMPPPNLLIDSSPVSSASHVLLDSVPGSIEFMTPESAHQPGVQPRILITAEPPTITTPAVIKIESPAECKNTVVVTTSCHSDVCPIPSESVFYPSGIDSPARPLNANDTEIRSQEVMEAEQKEPLDLDISGLNLLCNTIDRHVQQPVLTPPAVPVSQPLRKLDVLCVCAEQLITTDSSDSLPPPALPIESPTPPDSPLLHDDDELSPPILEKMSDITFDDSCDISKPPKLTPNSPVRDDHRWEMKQEPLVILRKRSIAESPTASSKKRKVGRPKKQFLTTEMFVVKRERSQVKLEPTVQLPELSHQPPPNVTITASLLCERQLPLRVLTTKEGLFYPGQLFAIQAPDLYGIKIDGERGNKEHICSMEDILKDTILEVKPQDAAELQQGTRVCAFWSHKWRCLYPGTVAIEKSTADDDRFVSMEFDDGDCGRIALEDIRFLPPDYPIRECAPDPLSPKRKPRNSVTEKIAVIKLEKILDVPNEVVIKNEVEEEESEQPVPRLQLEPIETLAQPEEQAPKKDLETVRKHLKKKRREKLRRLQSLSLDGTLENGQKRSCSSHRHHHKKHRKHKRRHRERLESTESHSKIAAFLPARQLWAWADEGSVRSGGKGRGKKTFHSEIRRGKEVIRVGDCAVFLSMNRQDRPFIGRIKSFWESCRSNKVVRVNWFYHPEETAGCPALLKHPGPLFESPHEDNNDVQTISHKCEVLPLSDFLTKVQNDPGRYQAVYENKDLFYHAGKYNPYSATLQMAPNVE